jgi:hypothetical protein
MDDHMKENGKHHDLTLVVRHYPHMDLVNSNPERSELAFDEIEFTAARVRES